jgi:hypothetical protein
MYPKVVNIDHTFKEHAAMLRQSEGFRVYEEKREGYFPWTSLVDPAKHRYHAAKPFTGRI